MTNIAPKFNSLGYIRIQTTDIARWRTFAFDALGFAAGTGPDDTALYLRMDEHAARLIVVPGDVDQVLAVGWQVRDHSALQEVVESVEKSGVNVQAHPERDADARR